MSAFLKFTQRCIQSRIRLNYSHKYIITRLKYSHRSTKYNKSILNGIRVLDFTRLLPGPFATQILADMGAEVIKIEQPNTGDYIRHHVVDCVDGNSIAFHSINRGKKSVSLNLKDTSDKTKLDKLISTCDVIIESFRPGVMSKLGYDSHKLLKQYPTLIYCSISGYGQTGPNKFRAGHDINYLARAGLLGLSHEPTLPPAQIADLCGGSMPAALQIVAALYHRINSGKGNIIDVSMTDNSYSLGVIPHSIVKNSDIEMSDGHYVLCGQTPCYNIYQCQNGYVTVGCFEQKFWTIFCESVLNAKHLISKKMVKGEEAEKVKQEIGSILKTKTIEEWKLIMEQYDCCVEVIEPIEQVTHDTQIEQRHLDIAIEISTGPKQVQKLIVPKTPLNMSNGLKFQCDGGPSEIGEHNHPILDSL